MLCRNKNFKQIKQAAAASHDKGQSHTCYAETKKFKQIKLARGYPPATRHALPPSSSSFLQTHPGKPIQSGVNWFRVLCLLIGLMKMHRFV
jgi:hypothetical protein